MSAFSARFRPCSTCFTFLTRNTRVTRQDNLKTQICDNNARKFVHRDTRINVLQLSNFSCCSKSTQRKYSTGANNEKQQRPQAQSTIDEEEMEKFRNLSEIWWDELGKFQALHTMNELRIPMIRDCIMQQQDIFSEHQPLEGLKVLDVGCGGGLISEPLARLGAFVVGVDMVEESIQVAQTHLNEDPSIVERVKYINCAVEDLVGTEEESFDAVIASEVVEHVSSLSSFITSCSQLLKPNGSLFITTLNKTMLSQALGVYGAEYILRLVPPGTHDWNKFVPPEDLEFHLENNGLSKRMIHGMLYNPLTCRWTWIQNTDINYAVHAVKATGESDTDIPDDEKP